MGVGWWVSGDKEENMSIFIIRARIDRGERSGQKFVREGDISQAHLGGLSAGQQEGGGGPGLRGHLSPEQREL